MIFGWCSDGHHKDCKRSFKRGYYDPKTKKHVTTDEVIRCECPKRGCECYVPAKSRTKKTARRKK